jgi:hypothetical protein
MLISRANAWQDDLAGTKRLISLFFGVKFLCDFGLWWVVLGCEIEFMFHLYHCPVAELGTSGLTRDW